MQAYANWKRAQGQLKVSQNDLAIALMEISMAEAGSGRALSIVRRSLARGKLAQAEAALAETQSAYWIALAGVDRSVGAPNRR